MPQPEVIKIICQAAPDNGIDWSGVLSTGVAFLAFFFSLRTATQGKRIEIQTKRFERLSIQPIESAFAALDELFQSQGNTPASTTLQRLTERVTNVNVVLSHINKIYPNFDYAKLVDDADTFTDHVYNSQTQLLADFYAEYNLWKLTVLDALYKALDKEVNRWIRW